VSFKPAA
jgi:hypothetical protein